MLQAALPAATARRRLGRRESVALLAALMASNAIGIDAMLPALPAVARDLGASGANQQQLIIIVYMLGFGAGQIFWGPFADRFGRRLLLLAGMLLFALFSIVCAAAPSFLLLIVARFAMGLAGAASRVLVSAIVRDLFSGEAMARIMSLVFMIFMIVPILAPSLGQAVLLVAGWRTIFLMIAGLGLMLATWAFIRLPETLDPANRRGLDFRSLLSGARFVVRDRLAVGYTVANTCFFGALSAYVASIQQLVGTVFHATSLLPLVFAACSGPMALAAFTNSRIVGRFGLRTVSHGGMIAYATITLVHLAIAWACHERLALFVLFQSLALLSYAFCSSNFAALAMSNMGTLAGTASSLQGVTQTIGGALIGLAIGQAFDGTVIPFLAGTALAGSGVVLIVALTERGRLFRPRVPVPA